MVSNFSNMLRHCRHLAGLSQMELALDAGVSPRHLSFLESGRAKPGRDVVMRLAAALRLAGTSRNALFVSAGFVPMADAEHSPPDRLRIMERTILSWPPCALADSGGYIRGTNVGMRALHVALSGVVVDLDGLSAIELALGRQGFGPHLTNREVLQRRFAHCRALETLVAGAEVDNLPPPADATASRQMLFAGCFGALAFDLVEVEEGHRLHGPSPSFRAYVMVPSDHRTETSLSTMVAQYEDRLQASSSRKVALRRAS